MSRHSKEKGAAYERKICQRLSLWVSDQKRTDVYWRSAMSGGRATLAAQRKDGKKFDAQSGDISAIHPLGALLLEHFVIDTKHYKDFDTDGIIFGRDGLLLPLWRKLVEEADEVEKEPMLICKQNRKPELLVVREKGYDFLLKGLTNPYDVQPIAILPKHEAWVFSLVAVLTNVDFRDVRAFYENPRNR